jgi:ankyrin repeat protein
LAQLPEKPNLEWLRKQAKRRLRVLRQAGLPAQLAHAQFDLAKDFGFRSWRELKANVESLTVPSQMIVAAKNGDAKTLATLLDARPDLIDLRAKPYETTLLHAGAAHFDVVDLLLERGFDPNVRERGDNTYAMHWAAAAGKLDVVRRLADAGGDVIGHGDDHQMEVIGWASCWDGCQDDAHRAVREFLISRGARHHIFSAVAAGELDEVRRLVAADPTILNSRQSRNENNRTPLQYAVSANKPELVSLLVELGADPLAVDGWAMPVAAYATNPDIDRPVMERIHALTESEIASAGRGDRPMNAGALDLMASLALADWSAAERLLREQPRLVDSSGILHLMTKRGDGKAVGWLLRHGANVDSRYAHWDSEVTPIHLAILANHPAVVSVLLDAGADVSIKDSKHEGDAMAWAEFFKRAEIVEMLKSRSAI